MDPIFSREDIICNISGKIMLNPVLTPEGYYVEYFELIKKEIKLLKDNNINIFNYSFNDFSSVISCSLMQDTIASYLDKNPSEKKNQYQHDEFNIDILYFLLYVKRNNINNPIKMENTEYQEAAQYFCTFKKFTFIMMNNSSNLTHFLRNHDVIKHIANCNQNEINIRFKNNDEKYPSFSDKHIIYTYFSFLPDESFTYLIQNTKKELLFIELHNHNNLLHFIAYRDNIPALKYLIDLGIDINKPNDKGETPLHIACNRPKNASVIKFLIQNGANPYLADINGNTSFHNMLNHQLYMTIQYYLKHLEDPSILQIKNNFGIDLFQILRLKGRIDLVDELIQKYQLDTPSKKRRTLTSYL